jgi:hypothetical protein
LFNVVDELERSENVEKRITICANPLSVCQAYENDAPTIAFTTEVVKANKEWLSSFELPTKGRLL